MNAFHTVPAVRVLQKALVISALTLGMVNAAWAAAPAAAPIAATAAAAAKPGEGRHGQAATAEERQARRAAHMAARQAHLARRQAAIHDKLKLSSAQEPAWNAYLAASKPPPRPARGERGQAGQRGEWASLSAPARMEKRLARSRERLAIMDTRLAALNTFYAQLTPEQKTVFDTSARRGGPGMRGHGRHGGPDRGWGRGPGRAHQGEKMQG